jgi:hypothetical protein
MCRTYFIARGTPRKTDFEKTRRAVWIESFLPLAALSEKIIRVARQDARDDFALGAIIGGVVSFVREETILQVEQFVRAYF